MKYYLILTSLLFSFGLAGAEPVRMIFDTDMGNDIDDAMALAIIHQLVERGNVDLLCVTSTKDHPKSASFIDAVNTYYGHPDVPIGAVRNGATPEEGKFNGVADHTDDDGKPLYPHDLKSGVDAPEAVSLMRKTLAAQPDGSVMLVQVGFFTNCARLLDSKPDEHSDLDGKALIKKKVKEFVIMAGAFQTIRYNSIHIEYNVLKDIPAAQKVAEEWPTPVIWSGFEIGINSVYPWKSIMEDYNYNAQHIIKENYLAYVPEHPHDRPTWDLSCVLYSAFPDRGYFDLSPVGNVTVDDKGITTFTTKGKNEGKNDRYLLMSDIQAARIVEAYIHLCSQPPTAK